MQTFMETDAGEIRLSPSSISEYQDCGHRYYLEQVKRLPRNPKARSLALIEGASMHAAIRAMAVAEAKGQPLTPAELEASVRAEHLRELALGYKLDDPMISISAAEFGSVRRALALARCAYGLSPQFLPVLAEDSERTFEYHIPPAQEGMRGVRFKWRLDLYARKTGTLWEFKSGSKAPDRNATMPLQDALYCHGLRLAGLPVSSCNHVTIVAKPDGSGLAAPYITEFAPPSEAETVKLFDRIGAVARGIALGAWVPARQDGSAGWICTARYCMRWGQCRYGTGDQ